MVYHAIDPTDATLGSSATRRPMLLDRIIWDDGWPTIDGGVLSGAPQPAPTIN